MSKIRRWFSGKKTYITGITAILGAVVNWIDTGNFNWNLVVTALIGIFLRAGVQKNK